MKVAKMKLLQISEYVGNRKNMNCVDQCNNDGNVISVSSVYYAEHHLLLQMEE